MDRSPEPDILPIDVVARILRTTPSQFRLWVRDGRVHIADGGCKELDALRAAIWRRLVDALGPKAARLAYEDVAGALEDRLPAGRIDVVYDFANGAAAVCSSDADLARAVLEAGHVHVLGLGEELDRVRRAVRKHLLVERPPAPTSEAVRRPRAVPGREGRRDVERGRPQWS
ncbi:MAG: hypothetical protein JWM18_934 [Chloroflexi bacterium]|nr:hypothetical protein [Chloroflexota bacterium]